ncbi:hypothetical protein PM082_022314 [Marasmius tenuissimus]|nr:hypothetical protein PM082_022314 [Marasmius tenuissimus]
MDDRLAIPLELIDQILKDCDQESLFLCSLVCKAWLALCRPRIFENVEINMNHNGLEKCKQLVSMNHIASYIRHLSLNGFCSVGDGGRSADWHEDVRLLDLTVEQLSRLKRRLNTLESLSIIGGELRQYGSRAFFIVPRLTSAFTAIVELDLRLEYEDSASLITFICSFPQLRVLRLRVGYYSDPYGNSQPSVPTCVLPLTLKSVHIICNDGEPIYYPTAPSPFHHWIGAHPPRQITLLSFIHYLDGGLPPIPPPYLTGLCKETKSLHLSFDFHKAWKLRETYDIVCPLTFLERIIFSFRNFDSDLDIAAITLHKMIQMFGTIGSANFRTAVFNVLDHNGLEYLCNEWNEFDDLLCTEKFASCAVELVVLYSTGEGELVASAGRKAFPKSDREGRLSIVQAPFARIEYHDDCSAEKEMDWACNRPY